MAPTTRHARALAAVTRYVQVDQQIRQLEEERAALRPEVIRYLKTQKRPVDVDGLEVVYETHPVYRFSAQVARVEYVVQHTQQALKEEREREIANGLAVETGRTEVVTIRSPSTQPSPAKKS